MMRVAVIGTGYVGLTTGVSLAYLGHEVACVDVDADKINRLREGELPFYEPLLGEMLAASWPRLAFTTSLPEAARGAEIVFFAVGTPANADGSPNLRYLTAAALETISALRDKSAPTVLVNKSTVPVGTGDLIGEEIRKAGLSHRVSLASNPEFLRQGRAVRDTLYPERIVAGGDEAAVDALERLYADILTQRFPEPAGAPRPAGLNRVPFVKVDRKSAEMSKYAANAFLAMKISFINEIANVCDRVGADVRHVSEVIGLDPRIGPSFLQAGIGYGGSCFPKDTRALQYIADTNGYDFKLLSAVIEVNNAQRSTIVDKAREALRGLGGKSIAVLGLAFKPHTDDLREAPSLWIIDALLREGAEVRVHDPAAADKARGLLPPGVRLAGSAAEALRGADAALLVTEWPEYLELTPDVLKSEMRNPLVIDGRNALSVLEGTDVIYRGIGIGRTAERAAVSK
jgi:UDPglucose 6-dehydrogenase